jgi:hypothetical protein
MSIIHQYLSKHGPTSTSELKAHIIKLTNVTEDTARKQISRFKGAKRLHNFFLPKGEAILFLEEHVNTTLYWNRLKLIVGMSNSAVGKAYRAIALRGGAIEARDFHIVACAPTMPRSKVMGSSTVITILLGIGLVKEVNIEGVKIYHIFGVEWSKRHQARATTESVAINLLKRYVTNLNMSSFNAISIRGDQKHPQMFSYQWDLTGPSYLSAFTSWDGNKVNPGHLASDVILSSNVSLDSLSAYLSKVDAVQKLSKTPTLMMLVCESFEPETFKVLRNRGIIPATTNNLFGKDAADLLRRLESVFNNEAAAIVSDPNAVFNLFERLKDFENDLKPIRGYLFEYIIANLHNKEGCMIDVNQMITAPNGDQAEIDVKAVRGQAMISSECKGFAPGATLTIDVVKDWVERQVPRIYAWFTRGTETKYISEKEIEFHFYFSGKIDPDLRSFCEKISESTKRYKISFFDYDQIIPRLKNAGCAPALVRLNQFFT